MIEPHAALASTLTRVADLLAAAERPWWVIGSAAAALHGAAVAVKRDVDVLIDPADMPLLAERAGATPHAGIPDGRFHSDRVLRLDGEVMPMEFFANLRVKGADGCWSPLRPRTREAIVLGAARVYVPAAGELIAILTHFGRAKDRARAARLRDLMA